MQNLLPNLLPYRIPFLRILHEQVQSDTLPKYMKTFQNIEVLTELSGSEVMLTKTAKIYIIKLNGWKQKLIAYF